MTHKLILVLLRPLTVDAAYISVLCLAFSSPVTSTTIGADRGSGLALLSAVLERLAFMAAIYSTWINGP